MNTRGHNDLLEACYRDLGRAAFINDLIFSAVVVGIIVVLWGFA